MSKKEKDKLVPEGIGPTPNPLKTPASLQRVVGVEQITASFSGPLPPPETLEGYNSVLPGAAERILVMAERQSAHRQDLEKMLVCGNVRHDLLGMVFGFIICILLISAGAFLAYTDKLVMAFASMLSGVALIVGAFLQSNRKKREEKKTKKPFDKGTEP